jgi:hypothetical protein
MYRRGRSRQISPAAVNRRASEERNLALLKHQQRSSVASSLSLRRKPPSSSLRSEVPLPPSSGWLQAADAVPGRLFDTVPVLSPSSYSSSRSLSPTPLPTPTDLASSSPATEIISLDFCESPLSPARTLEDQLYVAYADDNIRLAKIILLKLKGVNITSDEDPRIDEVTEDDFDECFVPSGGLDLCDLQVDLEAARKREREKLEERLRIERLRECERKWVEEKERVRREKLQVQQRKELKEKQMAAEREKARVREMGTSGTRPKFPHRSQTGLASASPLAYTYDRASRSPLASSQKSPEIAFRYECMPPIPKVTQPSRASVFTTDEPKPVTVSFKEVLASMHGPLFSIESTHQHGHAQPRLAQSKTATLLESLLKVVEWEDGERRKTKGKSAEPFKRTGESTGKKCIACSLPSPTISTPGISRTNSWLSFGVASSTSSTSTSPAASPISSWLKSTANRNRPKPSSDRTPLAVIPLPHSCQSFRTLTPVAASDSPLPIPVPRSNHLCASKEQASSSFHEPLAVPAMAGIVTDRAGATLFKRVSTLVDFAKVLQKTYLGPDSATSLVHFNSSRHHLAKPRAQLRSPGYRARQVDVAAFLSNESTTSPDSPPATCIPLRSPHGPGSTPVQNRTLAFPPPHPLPRSPLRPINPPPCLYKRWRPVENPMVLRLRALQNLMWERGQQWEGRAPDNHLGCGRDRLVVAAWEGLGRSGLGWEMRVVTGF